MVNIFVDCVNCFDYNAFIATTEGQEVTGNEFKRFLAQRGATFKQGTKHEIVTLNGTSTTLPRHPAKELKEGTRQAILKQLGLK